MCNPVILFYVYSFQKLMQSIFFLFHMIDSTFYFKGSWENAPLDPVFVYRNKLF